MDITRAEQIALDDPLVAPANRLKIGKKIYMQKFWATATIHHHSIRFKMNNKKHIVNLEYFREMLQICPKFPNQQFEELSFEEAILTFLRDLGHSGEIKMITDVNVNKLHQPWRSFVVGMYHKKNIEYAYLLWEDFVYQVENKNVKKSNEMYYPRFTKVIVNFFMTKDQSIPRRNSVNWHYARDDYIHKDSESYKEYYAIASGAKPPKTKACVEKKQVGSDMSKTPPTKGKRLKTFAKAAKTAKKKQPTKTSKAKGLTVLSEVALTEAEQMKLATKRSLIQTHSSHTSGSGADEETSDIPGVPNVRTYGSDDEKISWISSEKDDDDEVAVNDDDDDNDDDNDDVDNQDDDGQEYDEHDDKEQGDDDEQTYLDNDGDDFVHPKFSTHDEEDKEEDSFDPRVQTPSHVESTNDEDSDEEIQDANVEGDKMNEEETNEEAEVDALYRDVKVNMEGRDIEMTDAPCTISSFVSSGFVSNMLNPSPDIAVSLIPGIVDAYLANKMHEAVKIAIQLQSERIRDEAQAKNADFINKLDDNIKKIIKNQTSHDVVANLSELELKKILLAKMERNKSIHRSDEQKNLYKALDKDEEPSARSNRGSKRRRVGKEPESTSEPKEKTSKTTGKSTKGSKSHHKSAGESAQANEPMHTTKDLDEPAHQEFETGVTEDQPNEETSQLPD
ncbi:hypothetical protein Tco_0659353 [Tanacetum coccineum]